MLSLPGHMCLNELVIGKSLEAAVQWLSGTHVFRLVPRTALEQMAHFAAARDLERGRLLYSEGAHADCVYVVVRGSFRSIRHALDGREQVLSMESEGAVLGVAEALTQGCYSSTMVATGPASILCLESSAMNRLCHEAPQVLWSLAMVLASEVKAYAELAAMLSLRSVDEKLALHLLTVAQDRGVITDQGCAFHLEATRPEIAARLGSVREVVSRSFSHLAARGLITQRGRCVTIPDLAALQRFSIHQQSARAAYALRP